MNWSNQALGYWWYNYAECDEDVTHLSSHNCLIVSPCGVKLYVHEMEYFPMRRDLSHYWCVSVCRVSTCQTAASKQQTLSIIALQTEKNVHRFQKWYSV